MLTETERAEIAALVEKVLAGQGRPATRPGVAMRRAVRPARAALPPVGEGPALSRADGLAELGRSLAELRGELTQRLEEEAREREKLARQLQGIMKPPGGGDPGQIQGVPPVSGPQPSGAGAPAPPESGSASSGGAGMSKPAGATTAQPQWAEPRPGEAAAQPPATGAGRGGPLVQDADHQGTAQKLARANFDLAEALNENLRHLKEIVDRSQGLVTRIEEILRRHGRGR